MALKKDPVTAADIGRFVSSHADFSFELEALGRFTSLGLDPEHAGTYSDPVTGKTREFDIRASSMVWETKDARFWIQLAVECKNIREYNPLLVHCLPRVSREAYACVVHGKNKSRRSSSYGSVALNLKEELARRIMLWGAESLYRDGESVGKSCDQVGLSSSGELVGGDRDVFEKVSQAIASSHDLIRQACYSGTDHHDEYHLVVPMLVVPDGRLWVVDYNAESGKPSTPRLADRIEYYLDKDWLVEGNEYRYGFRAYTSHMEIVTMGSVAARMREIAAYAERFKSRSEELLLFDRLPLDSDSGSDSASD